MYYFCDDCNKVFLLKENHYEINCPDDSCSGVAIQIDENMIPAIKALWDKGYPTQFCCSGHPWRKYGGYIKFIQEINLSHAPTNWRLESPYLIRMKDFDTEDMVERQKLLFQRINNLLEWIDRLPFLETNEWEI